MDDVEEEEEDGSKARLRRRSRLSAPMRELVAERQPLLFHQYAETVHRPASPEKERGGSVRKING